MCFCLWARAVGLKSHTLAHQGEQIQQGILKSFHALRSHSPDKVYHQQFLLLTSDSDLDIWASHLGLTCNKPTVQGETICQVILKSFQVWRSYGLDKKQTKGHQGESNIAPIHFMCGCIKLILIHKIRSY